MNLITQRIRLILEPTPAWLALASAIGLSLIGISAIHSIPFRAGQLDLGSQQTQWLVIGLIVALLCLIPHPRQITLAAYPLLVVTLILQLILIIPGMPESIVPVRNNARAWLNLGVFTMQPSELTKITFILALAHYLRLRESYRTLPGLLTPFLLMFIPMGMIQREPDTGSTLMFPPALFAVLLAAGARMRHMLTLLGIGVGALILTFAVVLAFPEHMPFLKPYQIARIRSMVFQMQGDTRYLKNIGYQQSTATMLVGAGRVTGLGAERSNVILKFNSLPEAQNDMVFAVIACRWGLAGGLVTLGLYAALIASFLLVAVRSKDPFARLVVVGFAAIVLAQVTINVGMSLGLVPIIGITLPFVSAGGSSLVASYIMVGLALNFASHRPASITRPSFEFDRAEGL